MTWTYTGDPNSSTKDAVRFLVGDTATADQQSTDEEIAFALSENGDNVYLAGVLVAEAIAALYARRVDVSVGRSRTACAQRQVHYQTIADRLHVQAVSGMTVTFGGVSVAVKDALDGDASAVQPSFRKGMTDIGLRSLDGSSDPEERS